MAGARVGALLDIAKFSVMLAGDVPETIIERMREKFGEASLFARRSFGRMNDSSPHRVIEGAGPCERVFALALFHPHKGKAAELRALAEQLFAHARANDPGTWGYDWFFNDVGDCVTLDIDKNSAALAAHMANCGRFMAHIVKIADSETIVLGALPPEVESRMSSALNIKRFPRQLHGVI